MKFIRQFDLTTFLSCLVITSSLIGCDNQPRTIPNWEDDYDVIEKKPESLRSKYADELDCIAPNLPMVKEYIPKKPIKKIDDHIAISSPALEHLHAGVCLNFGVNQSTLTQQSQKVWTDFLCQIGYTDFSFIAIQQSKNDIPSKLLEKRYEVLKTPFLKNKLIFNDIGTIDGCDASVFLLSEATNNDTNVLKHICYPTNYGYGDGLSCEAKNGCYCGSHEDKSVWSKYKSGSLVYDLRELFSQSRKADESNELCKLRYYEYC